MESLYKISERIVDAICPDKKDEARANAINGVLTNIKYAFGDTLKMVKNINETSLPGNDRITRIKELESKFGIPVKDLL